MRKILVLRFSSIGDIVLTSPVVRCLKKQLPDAEIHFCTKSSFRQVVENNPHIDKMHYLEKDLNDLVKRLKEENFSEIIDLHNSLRSRIISWKLGIKTTRFPKLNWEKWLMVNFKINKLPHVHIVDRYFETTDHLGVKKDGEGLEYFTGNESLPEATTALLGASYEVIVLGAKHNTKRLPEEKVRELISRLLGKIVLLGGPEESAFAEQVIKDQDKEILNFTGKLSLHQSALVIKNAERVFTNDTGLMHIAAAYKKNIYSFWGNTIPQFGMYPYKTDYEIFQVKNLSCRPCSKIGYQKCPKGHFKCMKEIDLSPIR